MAEKFTQRFELDAPVDLVWAFLTDPYQVITCLPGAAITSRIDARTDQGTITVKVGLVTADYKGKVIFERLDAATHEMEIVGVGQDVKGKGSAEMRMGSQLRAVGSGHTEVVVNTEVVITGLFAQMGRGIIQSVADQMVTQFTAQLKRTIELAKAKYADIVKIHAESFVKIYAQKVTDLQSLSGIKVSANGANTASSPSDVMKYLEAIKQIAGDMIYNSAKIILKNAAQKEKVPLPEL